MPQENSAKQDSLTNESLREIVRDLGRLEGRVSQIAETVDRNRTTANEGLAKIEHKIDALTTAMTQLNIDKAKVQGGYIALGWVVGAAATAGALVATIIKWFWTGA